VETLRVKVIGFWCQKEDLHNQLKFLLPKKKQLEEFFKKRFALKIIKDNNCMKLLIS